MNTVVLHKFSSEIVRGATSLGVVIQEDHGTLSSEQGERLERQTGRSVGELALLGIEAVASPEQRKQQRDLLRSTMELMSTFGAASDKSPARQSPTRRPSPAAKPRVAT